MVICAHSCEEYGPCCKDASAAAGHGEAFAAAAAEPVAKEAGRRESPASTRWADGLPPRRCRSAHPARPSPAPGPSPAPRRGSRPSPDSALSTKPRRRRTRLRRVRPAGRAPGRQAPPSGTAAGPGVRAGPACATSTARSRWGPSSRSAPMSPVSGERHTPVFGIEPLPHDAIFRVPFHGDANPRADTQLSRKRGIVLCRCPGDGLPRAGPGWTGPPCQVVNRPGNLPIAS